ncbi:hypothetical protein GCM10010269_26900 [Streptomyces humidus]|uniref:Uncharacterized protein n=1 Tax=Streptomyces humidus TaxID=52259 RepID=A0A918FV66_9ACTN|nr:hypothetical protein GCM10010269_26900 [Streptomyces humidus]
MSGRNGMDDRILTGVTLPRLPAPGPRPPAFGSRSRSWAVRPGTAVPRSSGPSLVDRGRAIADGTAGEPGVRPPARPRPVS